MGREFASACARWIHLEPIGARLASPPSVTRAPRFSPGSSASTRGHASCPTIGRYSRTKRSRPSTSQCLHNLHEEIYVACLRAGKHLLGEKPFGIDLAANAAINVEIGEHPDLLVRCSSSCLLPAAPGGGAFIGERRFRRPIEMRALFLHVYDLDPAKPINWKRIARLNGEYAV